MEPLAEVRSYADLQKALRARAEELDISRATLDQLSGLDAGYCGKLLAPNPKRNIGFVSIGLLLGALGLKLLEVEDRKMMDLTRHRLVRRIRRGKKAHPHPYERPALRSSRAHDRHRDRQADRGAPPGPCSE